MARAFVNMDGSSADADYRYQMAAVIVKVEGKSKMTKTVIENLALVCRDIGRPADHLLTFLGQKLSAATKMEKDGRAYVTGHHAQAEVQSHIFEFIREVVACGRCKNPETTCHVEGQKKNKSAFLLCKACSNRTVLDPADRFVKYIVQHPPESSGYGHAASAQAGGAAGIAKATALAEAARASKKGKDKEKKEERTDEKKVEKKADEKKDEKKVCGSCGHKTTKAVCKKCGAQLVESVDVEPIGAEEQQSARVEAEQTSELQEASRRLVEDVCDACDFNVPKLQPQAVAEKAGPVVARALAGPLRDPSSSAVGTFVKHIWDSERLQVTPTSAKEIVLAGILLALRSRCDQVSDEELAAACRRLEPRGVVLAKFIGFLEEDSDDDDSDGELHEGQRAKPAHRCGE